MWCMTSCTVAALTKPCLTLPWWRLLVTRNLYHAGSRLYLQTSIIREDHIFGVIKINHSLNAARHMDIAQISNGNITLIPLASGTFFCFKTTNSQNVGQILELLLPVYSQTSPLRSMLLCFMRLFNYQPLAGCRSSGCWLERSFTSSR